jgi:hypothetical protein
VDPLEAGSQLAATLCYFERIRRAKGRALAHLGSGTGLTPFILSRIECGSADQINLADVIALDETLEQGGRLLMLYWSAA